MKRQLVLFVSYDVDLKGDETLRQWAQYLNVRAVYAKSNIQYWLNFVNRLEQQKVFVVTLDLHASKRLTELNVPNYYVDYSQIPLNDDRHVAQVLNSLEVEINNYYQGVENESNSN